MIANRTRSLLRLVAAPALAAGLLAAAPLAAQAQDDDRPATQEEIEKIRQTLEAKGYTNVHDIEVDDGRFEVDARHPDGHEVDLELDLQTLEILYEKRD
jgi:uncharacterized membrane protein YkoI